MNQRTLLLRYNYGGLIAAHIEDDGIKVPLKGLAAIKDYAGITPPAATRTAAIR